MFAVRLAEECRYLVRHFVRAVMRRATPIGEALPSSTSGRGLDSSRGGGVLPMFPESGVTCVPGLYPDA